MMPTIFIMTSLATSSALISPLARLPTSSRLIPTRIAKKMIESISPSAIAAIGLSGTMLTSTSDSAGASAPSKLALVSASIPWPMPMTPAMASALAIASAVVIMYSANAFVPMRPSRRTSPMPHTPLISENSTSGTTSIFSALTNRLPTTPNRPSIR